jgi:hypothetical protein
MLQLNLGLPPLLMDDMYSVRVVFNQAYNESLTGLLSSTTSTMRTTEL